MSQQVSAAKSQAKQPSGHSASSPDARIKLPENKNVKSVFEPSSKIAVLGYN